MPDTHTASPDACERVLTAIVELRGRGIVSPTLAQLAKQSFGSVRNVARALNALEAQGRIRRHRIEVLAGGER